jgi:imidazolonepropionase-like amidohydrolase
MLLETMFLDTMFLKFIPRLVPLVLALAFSSGPTFAQTVLLEGARIIPGDGSPAIEDGALLVDGGAIARVGRKGDIAPPTGAVRINLDGKTVMPAIVSAHVHPGFQKGLTYLAGNYTRENILDDLNRALYFGISTVMSQGIEKGEVMYRIRADQAAGRLGAGTPPGVTLRSRSVRRAAPSPHHAPAS